MQPLRNDDDVRRRFLPSFFSSLFYTVLFPASLSFCLSTFRGRAESFDRKSWPVVSGPRARVRVPRVRVADPARGKDEGRNLGAESKTLPRELKGTRRIKRGEQESSVRDLSQPRSRWGLSELAGIRASSYKNLDESSMHLGEFVMRGNESV